MTMIAFVVGLAVLLTAIMAVSASSNQEASDVIKEYLGLSPGEEAIGVLPVGRKA
ncbi:MAG: hypothetical protein NTY37_05680 [Methanothrix sp.]|nr:hypothetical protein [Methanothrix sp.]